MWSEEKKYLTLYGENGSEREKASARQCKDIGVFSSQKRPRCPWGWQEKGRQNSKMRERNFVRITGDFAKRAVTQEITKLADTKPKARTYLQW